MTWVPALDGIVREIARHLTGWTLALPDHSFDAPSLAAPDGRRVRFRLERRGRLVVFLTWPRDGRGHIYYPAREEAWTITLDPARPATAVARDIARRLLSRYLTAWQEQVARRDAADQENVRAEAFAHALERALGVSPRLQPSDTPISIYSSGALDEVARCRFQVYRSGGSIALALTTDHQDLILDIAALLTRRIRRGPRPTSRRATLRPDGGSLSQRE
jgi:hypothetical protein